MTESEQLKWGSHLPAIGACLAVTTGSILEFGCGHFSTPFLWQYSRASGRPFVSLEKDREWGERFNGTLIVQDYVETVRDSFASKRWSVVLIDNSPGGEARLELFILCLPISEFVVVHDYHMENSDAIDPYTVDLKMRHVFNRYEPPTLVASLTRSFPV